MAFSNTFDSLSNAIIPQDIPVELVVDNHGVIINPNQGSYFYLDDINENLNITLTNPTNSYCRTVYLRLSFENDNLVMNWPSNINWYENVPPLISKYEEIFIILTTLDGGTTWYSNSLIKVKPLVNLTNYMFNTYGSAAMQSMTTLPYEVSEYVESVIPTSLASFFCDSEYDGCSLLTSVDLSSWDISRVTSLQYTFCGCYCLVPNVSNWDTSNVISMEGTFEYCSGFATLDLSNWDTSNVATLRFMFYNCNTLTSLDLSNWDTSQVYDMYGTFRECHSLISLDLSNWNTSSVVDSNYMFDSAPLQYLILNSSTVKFTKSDSLRSGCKILVPSSALDTYKAHSAWSSRASQFDAIENYTIVKSNGTVTVTPNNS